MQTVEQVFEEWQAQLGDRLCKDSGMAQIALMQLWRGMSVQALQILPVSDACFGYLDIEGCWLPALCLGYGPDTPQIADFRFAHQAEELLTKLYAISGVTHVFAISTKARWVLERRSDAPHRYYAWRCQ